MLKSRGKLAHLGGRLAKPHGWLACLVVSQP
jgi:hypothetical protein